MTIENKFEEASRLKLRFQHKGPQRVEDLWDFEVEELDSIYKTLNAQVKRASEESLLQKPTKENRILELQIDIIKHIVKVKQTAKDNNEQLAMLKSEEAKLLELKAAKQQEELKSKTPEEIDELLAAIQAKKNEIR